MKRYLGIFFLSVYLLSSNYGMELFKLPFLFEHFQEHKAFDQQMTFYQFLSIHYSKNTKKDSDYQKDVKLPFKTINTNSTITAIYDPISIPFSFEEKNQIHLIVKQNFKQYKAPKSKSALFSIWNPPKQFC